MDQRGERCVIGRMQTAIMPIHPFDRAFEREARMKAAPARIGQGKRFRLPRKAIDLGKFSLEEGELTHCNPAFPASAERLW